MPIVAFRVLSCLVRMADILAGLAQKADSLSALQLTGALCYSLSNTPIRPPPHSFLPAAFAPPPPPHPTFWTTPPPLCQSEDKKKSLHFPSRKAELRKLCYQSLRGTQANILHSLTCTSATSHRDFSGLHDDFDSKATRVVPRHFTGSRGGT